jgi:hypothetical protein
VHLADLVRLAGVEEDALADVVLPASMCAMMPMLRALRRAEQRLPDLAARAAERELGLKLDVGPIRLGLFPPRATVGSIRAAQPGKLGDNPLFRVDAARLDIKPASLLLGRVTVSSLAFTGAAFRVVRTAEGRLNLSTVRPPPAAQREAQPFGPGATAPAGGASPAAAARGRGVPFVVERGAGDLRLHYTDFGLAPEPVGADLRLDVKALNIGTLGDAGNAADWGRVAATGELICLERASPVEVALRLAPLTADGSGNFDFEAHIGALDPRVADFLLAKADLKGELVDAAVLLVCRGSHFDQARSRLTLRLRNVTVTDKLARKLGRAPVLPEITLPIPVGGTVRKPKLRVEQALAVAVLGAFAEGSGPDVAGALESAIRGLEGLLGGKSKREDDR